VQIRELKVESYELRVSKRLKRDYLRFLTLKL